MAATEGALIHVLEPDDGQGWIKVRQDVHGDTLEGLVPAGYVEMSTTPLMAPQYRPQASNHVSPVGSPAAQPVMQHASPVSSPSGPRVAAGFPFNPPAMPGGYSPTLTPPTSSAQNHPAIPALGGFGQGKLLSLYTSSFSLLKLNFGSSQLRRYMTTSLQNQTNSA